MAQPARATAASLRRAAKKASDARSLFIRVEPAPANLAERRAVLRTLQRHGEVEMFKKLHDDRSFVSIASTALMAQALVARSPMRFEFITEKFDPRPLGHKGEITSPVEPIETAAPPPPGTLRRETGLLSQKAFVLHVHARADYQHRTAIRRSPLYGPWPDEDGTARESLAYAALRDAVPRGPDHDALCDWETGGQLSDHTRARRSLASTYRSAHAEDRQARRERADRTPSLESILAAPLGEPAADAREEASQPTPPAGPRWGTTFSERPRNTGGAAAPKSGGDEQGEASLPASRAGSRWGTTFTDKS